MSFRNRVSKRRGAAAVEFALVLPVFLALALGMLGSAAGNEGPGGHSAAREGCGVAALPGNTAATAQARVNTQSARFAASLVRGLRIKTESLRQKRKQRAEEMAQKAGTEILFPSLLFILPAIFVVFLGPAFFKIMRAVSSMAS